MVNGPRVSRKSSKLAAMSAVNAEISGMLVAMARSVLSGRLHTVSAQQRRAAPLSRTFMQVGASPGCPALYMPPVTTTFSYGPQLRFSAAREELLDHIRRRSCMQPVPEDSP